MLHRGGGHNVNYIEVEDITVNYIEAEEIFVNYIEV